MDGLKDSVENIKTWVKAHPWAAAGIVGGVILLAWWMSKNSSDGGGGGPSDEEPINLGGGGSGFGSLDSLGAGSGFGALTESTLPAYELGGKGANLLPREVNETFTPTAAEVWNNLGEEMTSGAGAFNDSFGVVPAGIEPFAMVGPGGALSSIGEPPASAAAAAAAVAGSNGLTGSVGTKGGRLMPVVPEKKRKQTPGTGPKVKQVPTSAPAPGVTQARTVNRPDDKKKRTTPATPITPASRVGKPYNFSGYYLGVIYVNGYPVIGASNPGTTAGRVVTRTNKKPRGR